MLLGRASKAGKKINNAAPHHLIPAIPEKKQQEKTIRYCRNQQTLYTNSAQQEFATFHIAIDREHLRISYECWQHLQHIQYSGQGKPASGSAIDRHTQEQFNRGITKDIHSLCSIFSSQEWALPRPAKQRG
ncbi:hypothetical protein Nepgr_006781 [Nepenthes gracilis]|uniref:Uncharacterized protein n=1 Tax=Nepenthes gracilis TaxID=150966 RepID=A0AAD3S668_NEPGR|nr:hypothetical protein Nepgr_006781 [Nepenthes gracilis]